MLKHLTLAVLTGEGVKVNAATVNLNATVTASQVNGVKTAEVTSTTTGTGPRGNSLARTGNYTVTYDSATGCVTLDGTWSATAGARSSSTVVSKYQRCKGTCPTAGGSIVNTSGRTVVTLTYDGSATAHWATAAGRAGTLDLQCGK